MSKTSLSVQEALRFANHDFLNHLHLIQMNLDLNRVDEAKQIIGSISKQCNIFSNTNKVGLPRTTEWLQTFEWRYPAISLKLISDVTVPLDVQWDEAIEQYLEKTILHVYDTLDPFTEQQQQITLKCQPNHFSLEAQLIGKWEAEYTKIDNSKLTIHTFTSTNTSWHYVLTIKE